MDTLQRSLTKTVIWRVIATLITLAVTYMFTGEIKQSTNIALVVAVFLVVGYYINERVWDRIDWGRRLHAFKTHNDSDI